MSEKRTSFSKNMEISCGDLLLKFDRPKVMGILNLTDDSFYDGGRYNKGEKYMFRAAQMIEEGVDIIDVGAASTRPGATYLDAKTEWGILQKPIQRLRNEFSDVLLSVDTYNAQQINRCAHSGVNIINDISGGSWDEKMHIEISKHKMAYVMMHIQGNPTNMQDSPFYNSLIDDMISYFNTRINKLEHLSFNRIILDPGFGFGKTMEHNYQILAQMKRFSEFHYPILAGLSRKSMIFRALGITPNKSLNGTAVLNTFALENGASIIRVHDVKQANETIKLVLKYKEYI